MTEILPDPTQEFFAQDPSILREPEQAQIDELVANSHRIPVAVGLAAAYMIYRTHMVRRLREELRKKGGDVSRHTILYAASGIWNAFVPRWVSMTVPYLIAGYLEGLRQADIGTVPPEMLHVIAHGYAEDLGTHINEVSSKAMVSGFQSQVNRRVPPAMAARRVANAYGVPQRPMNTLVNVWTAEEPKKLTDQPLPDNRVQRSEALIEAQNLLRSRQIGNHEHWATRTQAKQIVWMYGAEHGVIPSTARRVWITAADERVCAICGPMDGQSAPLGEKFETSAGLYWTPPTHINCRCDVVLDLTPSGVMQSEITALLESESVNKAQGRDRYDRDKRGRFARDEQRTPKYKERELGVDQMLERVEELLKPVELKPIELKTLGKVELKTLKPLTELKVLTPLVAPLEASPKTDLKQGLRGNLKTRLKLNELRARDLSSDLWNPQGITVEDVETDEGTWQYMDEVLTTVMDPYQVHEIGDMVMHDDQTPFYEAHGEGEVYDPGGRSPRTLNEAIGDYWDGWIESQLEEFRMDRASASSLTLYNDENSDSFWLVSEENYRTVLEDLVAGVPKRDQEIVDLEGINDYEGEVLAVTTGELAKHFELERRMQNDAPVLLQTKHGMPGVTEKLQGNEWRNPGRWRVVNVREVWDPHETNYHHLGYTILEVEPADLFEH